MIRTWVPICLVGLLSSVAGCTRAGSDASSSPTGPTIHGQQLDVARIATSVSSAGMEGSRRPGTPPPPGSGPRVSAVGNSTVINGGTQSVLVSGDAPFDTVYVYVAGRSLGILGEADGNVPGYYELRLPSPQTSATVLLAFPQDIPLNEFDLRFAVASPSGAVGPYTALSTTVTVVGTGDVQVTLSWDVDSDVDLHVVAPGGEELFYGRRRGASGGELDLDSNAACRIDGVRNENITWPTGRAPRGSYTVRVDYWSSCDVSRTNYTVRVNNGGAVAIYSGSFTGTGDGGSAGSGRTIATFERTSGPTAIEPSQLLNLAAPWSAKLAAPSPGRR